MCLHHGAMMVGPAGNRKADHRVRPAAILSSMMTTERRFGAQSMSAPLLDVLVKRPGRAFGHAFDDPAHGFLHAVDLDVARREHDAFVETLASLGPRVHVLDTELETPDLVYTFDPLLVTDRGAIPLRPGKPNRAAEPAAIEAWTSAAGIPTVGRIEAPGTIEGGDTFWLRPDLFCIGRTLRTNSEGARQLAGLVGGDVRIFDVPYWRGPAELIHLMSVVSPVADDLAVVYLPLLPVGLWELLHELGIRLIEVPDEEFPTLGCNVLAVRPGVVILAEGNPRTSAALVDAGCGVHTYPATEIGLNGSGGPTCMTRPILRG
jgi:dimethylargininase